MKNLITYPYQNFRHGITLVFILFAISFILRFYFANFFKHIASYPDELFYYQLAESFVQENIFLVYNHPTSFQKILYSLFIAPAFFFENREIQQHIISFINCFLICSTIFPTYFIACRLLNNNFSTILILIISLLLPDLSYSITFMAENLFLPLSLWLILLFFILIESPNFKKFYSIFLGIFCGISYFCKEISIFFPLAFFAYTIIGYYLKLHTKIIEQLKNGALVCLSFFITIYCIKILIFPITDANFYGSQLDFSGNIPPEALFSFMLFSFFNFLFCILIASGFFPFILPFVFWNILNINHKKFFLFLLLLVLETSITLTYTIYLREMDFYLPAPRSLLRYLCYLWVPILCLFLAFLEYKLPNKNTKLLFISSLPALLIFFIFKGSYGIFTVDSMMLHFIDARFSLQYIFIFKILLILLVCVFSLFFYQQKNKIILSLFALIMLGFIFNNFKNISEMRSFYAMDENHKIEMQNIENFIKENPNKKFLIANNQWWYNFYQPLADTFLNYKNIYTTNIEYFLRMADSPNAPILVKDYSIPLLWLYSNDSNKSYKIEKIDYIILPKKINIQFINGKPPEYFIRIKNAQPVMHNELFDIYKMHQPTLLPKIHIEF